MSQQQVRRRVLRVARAGCGWSRTSRDRDDRAGSTLRCQQRTAPDLAAGGELTRVSVGACTGAGGRRRFGMLGALAGRGGAARCSGWRRRPSEPRAGTRRICSGCRPRWRPSRALAVTHRRAGRACTRSRSQAGRRARGRREAELNGMEVTFLEALEGWDRYVEADAASGTGAVR